MSLQKISGHLITALTLSLAAFGCDGTGALTEADQGLSAEDQEMLAETSDAVMAPTECYVFIDPPCFLHPEVPSRVWIRDNYEGSPFNAGRCLYRAHDFHRYCGLPPQGRVTAAFNVVGLGTINAQNVGGPDQPVHTYGWNWVELPTR